MRFGILRTILAGLVIASLALLGACNRGTGATRTDADRLLGTWVVDSHLATYTDATGEPQTIDLAQHSTMTVKVRADSIVTECSPPCAGGVLRRIDYTYTLDEGRKQATFRTTAVDLIPALAALEAGAVGQETVYGYSFPSANTVQFTGPGEFYQDGNIVAFVDGVITATRQ